jgi:hypothetical protein
MLSATAFAESDAEGKSTCSALLCTVGVKGVAVTAGADSSVLDRFCGNSGLPQLALICGPQIEVRPPVTLQDYRIESVGVECGENLGINRVAAWSNGWSDSDQEVGRVCAKFVPERADDGSRNPSGRTAPPSVRSTDDPAPTIPEGKRHTVGECKEEMQAWNIADDPVTAE